ncbi:MAG TPA: DUF3303 family protein [Dehalococcoidia bacterium]|nr:DUF3303 family protein [Dehalococcoidia bacterium]
MPRYLINWEMDTTKVPISPKERATAWNPMLDMVEQDMKGGMLKEWGSYIGEMRGYSVAEGTEVEIANMCQQYIPFVNFTTHPVLSLSEMREITKNLLK